MALAEVPIAFFLFFHSEFLAGVGEGVHPGVELDHGFDLAAVEVLVFDFEAAGLVFAFFVEEFGHTYVRRCHYNVSLRPVFAKRIDIPDHPVVIALHFFVIRRQREIERAFIIFKVLLMHNWPWIVISTISIVTEVFQIRELIKVTLRAGKTRIIYHYECFIWIVSSHGNHYYLGLLGEDTFQ